jgi:NAD(P)-dependent dehydrogenase (short-subunit alcohol dehydrogenase family)
MLVDRVALVSNANGPLGRQVGVCLAKNGYFVLLGVTDEVKGEIVANAVRKQGGAEMVPLVVTNPASVCALASYVEARYGRLDMLASVIGAPFRHGLYPVEAGMDLSEDTFHGVPFCDVILTLGFLPLLRKTPRARAVRLRVPWVLTSARSARSPSRAKATVCSSADQPHRLGVMTAVGFGRSSR